MSARPGDRRVREPIPDSLVSVRELRALALKFAKSMKCGDRAEQRPAVLLGNDACFHSGGDGVHRNETRSIATLAAGLVLGARVPIILTSRSDSLKVRLASAALAKLAAERRHGNAGLP